MYKHAIEMRSFACLCINALDSYEMQMNIYVFLLNLNVLCFCSTNFLVRFFTGSCPVSIGSLFTSLVPITLVVTLSHYITALIMLTYRFTGWHYFCMEI